MTKASPSIHSDRLLSIVAISSGNADSDLFELKRMLLLAQSHSGFFEIMIAAAVPSKEWVGAIKAAGREIANLRIVLFDSEHSDDYDALMMAAIDLAIGDVTMIVSPGEFSTEDLNHILDAALEGTHDVIKTRHAQKHVQIWERLILTLVANFLYFSTRHVLEPFAARTMSVSRTAGSKILNNTRAFRYFRVLDTSRFLREVRLEFIPERRPTQLVGLRRKLGVVAHLSSAAAPRFLSAFSVVAMGLSLLSIGYGVYTVLVLLIQSKVAEGWASISLVLSAMFTMVFALLSVISLAIMRILDMQEKPQDNQPMQEFSNADLFSELSNLNIEFRETG